ncbi:MAG: hypothetical protein U5L05_10560 [Rubrivivax sp.]|nr:hypothetical protein [Rubrivivax sp.]
MAATWFSPMTTHAPARSPVPVRRHTVARPRVVPVQAPVRAGWLERLALWAEARPAHRRLGSWTMDC